MPDRSLSYRPYLDGLRGIAVLFVFVFHAARPGLSGGFIGVDIFFVLSGYLITRILLTQHQQTGRIGIADFYSRRVRRLLPAVLLLVLVVVLREAVWGDLLATAERLKDALATLFYAENWNLIIQSDQYFAESLAPSPLRHAWSLSIEEQFYVVWPLLLIGILFAARRRSLRAIGLVAALAGISAIAMAMLFEPGLIARAYYGTGARAQQPLIGAALAFLMQTSYSRAANRRWVWPSVAALAMVLLFVMARWLTGESDFYYQGGSTVVAILAVALILALEKAPRGWIASCLSWNPLKQLGRISYGFYLWHWPIILWLAVPVGVTFWERRVVNLAQFGLTLAVSIASFLLLESPIRQETFRLGRLTPLPTVATGMVALGLVGATAITLLGPGTLSLPPVANEDTTVSPTNNNEDQGTTAIDARSLAKQALADPSYEPCPEDPQPCVKSDAGEGAPTVVLIGDSTAQAYDPALKVLATDYGFTYVQAAVGGCPLSHRLLATGTDGQLHKPSNLMCFDELPAIYDMVLTKYEPALFIATSWNETNQHIEHGVLLEKGTPEHIEATRRALVEAVERLTAQGARFAFIEVLPPGKSVDCLEEGDAYGAACIRPVIDASGEEPYNEIFREIAIDQGANVVSISLKDILCPDASCPLMFRNTVLRYDGGHFTATASRMLAPIIERRLANVGIDLAHLTD